MQTRPSAFLLVRADRQPARTRPVCNGLGNRMLFGAGFLAVTGPRAWPLRIRDDPDFAVWEEKETGLRGGPKRCKGRARLGIAPAGRQKRRKPPQPFRPFAKATGCAAAAFWDLWDPFMPSRSMNARHTALQKRRDRLSGQLDSPPGGPLAPFDGLRPLWLALLRPPNPEPWSLAGTLAHWLFALALEALALGPLAPGLRHGPAGSGRWTGHRPELRATYSSRSRNTERDPG